MRCPPSRPLDLPTIQQSQCRNPEPMLSKKLLREVPGNCTGADCKSYSGRPWTTCLGAGRAGEGSLADGVLHRTTLEEAGSRGTAGEEPCLQQRMFCLWTSLDLYLRRCCISPSELLGCHVSYPSYPLALEKTLVPIPDRKLKCFQIHAC